MHKMPPKGAKSHSPGGEPRLWGEKHQSPDGNHRGKGEHEHCGFVRCIIPKKSPKGNSILYCSEIFSTKLPQIAEPSPVLLTWKSSTTTSCAGGKKQKISEYFLTAVGFLGIISCALLSALILPTASPFVGCCGGRHSVGAVLCQSVQEVFPHGSYLSAQEASSLQGPWFP